METKSKFIEKIKKVKIKHGAMPCIIFAFALMTTTQGYCDLNGSLDQLNSVSTDFKSIIHSYWLKTIVLGAAGAMGGYKAFAANSVQPLILWVFIGFILAMMPRIIEVLASI